MLPGQPGDITQVWYNYYIYNLQSYMNYVVVHMCIMKYMWLNGKRKYKY